MRRFVSGCVLVGLLAGGFAILRSDPAAMAADMRLQPTYRTMLATELARLDTTAAESHTACSDDSGRCAAALNSAELTVRSDAPDHSAEAEGWIVSSKPA